MRSPNTNHFGGRFDEATVQAVWEKGRVVLGHDPNQRRQDSCGAWIRRSQYGVTTENGEGWEIDHVQPVAAGGPDALYNLQPLQWQNNRYKGDDYPHWTCRVKAA